MSTDLQPSLLAQAAATIAAQPAADPEPPSMNFLACEREALEAFMPGLDLQLSAIPLKTLESRENPGIALLKAARGPAMLIPREFQGLGASAVEASRVLRALGSRTPSLAIVATMHNFSVSTLVEWAIFGEDYGQLLLSSLAENSMYVASGFAEGRTGARPLDMTMQARRAPQGGWLISGKKKPCTLTHSMDFLSCGLVAETSDGVWQRAVGLIPADAEGLERRPFWKSHILAGAESDEVIVTDAHVPDDFVFLVEHEDALSAVEVTGFVWFQLALSSSYLGVASGLVERVLQSGKGTSDERGTLVSHLENQSAALEGIALGLQTREDQKRLLSRALSVRYQTQATIEHVAMRSAELLGGMAFIGSDDVSYLMCACRAMAFHPPGRLFAIGAIDQFARGGDLDIS